MHLLVTDSETGAVLLKGEAKDGKALENRDAIGTYSGPGTMHGPVYHGVKAWIAPATRVHDWEPEEDHVFIEWTDKSSTMPAEHSRVHTVERPLPGGAVYRFLVVAG